MAHPSRTALRALAAGTLAGAEVHRAVLHLLGCRGCRHRLGEQMEAADADLPERQAAAVDRAIAAAIEQSRRPPSERARQRSAASALRIAAGGQATGVSLAVVRALIELAAASRHDSPRRTLELAKLATVYVRWPPLDREHPRLANDVRALAFAELANALRINDRLAEAFAAIEDAAVLAAMGTGDVLVAARLLDVTATLHAAHRQFAEADTLLARVVHIYRSVGDAHLAGRACIARGLYAGYRNEPAEAIRRLREGLALIDGSRDPVLLLAARHGIAWWTADLGRYREARRMLFESRHLYAADHNEMNRLRLGWLEAKIAGGFGDLARAEQLLEGVGEAFGRLALPYKKALVTLDLAVVLLRQEKSRRVFEVLDETVRTFQRLGIHREALAGLIVLHEAAEQAVLSVAAVEAVAALLQRLEHLPAGE